MLDAAITIQHMWWKMNEGSCSDTQGTVIRGYNVKAIRCAGGSAILVANFNCNIRDMYTSILLYEFV